MNKKLLVNGISYPLDRQKTLLENLEAQAVAVEFHCRDGHCGVCKCKLVSGAVEYQTQPMAYLRDGEVLPCSGRSQGDIHLQFS